ncbi:MAG: zinc-binding dehydrogenase [Calditrichia bacterium]|nr:zinc-binding dehydrogenase [Calditrichia bacterium]
MINFFLTNNKIKPIIGKVFPFGEAAKAHELIELWISAGKILLEI